MAARKATGLDQERFLHPRPDVELSETTTITDGVPSNADIPAPPYCVLEPDLDDANAEPLSEPLTFPSNGYENCKSGEFLNRLNIVIQVVGSRGDVQPFIALGHGLQ